MYSSFNSEPIDTNPNKKYRFVKNELSQGEVEPFNRESITAENIYKSSFLLLQQPNKIRYDKLAESVAEKLGCNSEISKIFFSDANIKRVQKLLRKTIYEKSNGKYKMDVDQEEKELVYVMRAIFIEHAKDIPGQTIRQVKYLNRKVIDEVFPSVITSISHNQGYLNRINNPIKPIDRPLNVNNAGRRTLPGFSTIWEF
jgi:hypothetical protein